MDKRGVGRMQYAQIVGWGMYLPSNVMTNEELVEKGLDTSDGWITTRTGIRERHMVVPGEATSDLAVKAAERALQTADARPGDIDLIIVATCTPDHILPATAAFVQDRLGATRAAAMDLNAVCSGFVYGLVVAAGQIESGRCEQVLVIGAETLSAYVDWKDLDTCVLFGDGAGALVLRASREPGILAASLGSDGSGANLLLIPTGGSRQPASSDTLANGDRCIKMDGSQIYRFATQVMGKAAAQVMEDAGLTTEDIDLLIPHQANLRIIEATAKRLRLPVEKMFINLDKYGNTSAASIPIAMCEAIEEGRISSGDHVVLTAFGAGLSWGAVAVRWGSQFPTRLSRWSRFRHRIQTRISVIRSWLRREGRRIRAMRNGSV